MLRRLTAICLTLFMLLTAFVLPAQAEMAGITELFSSIFSSFTMPGIVGRWQVVDFIGSDSMKGTIDKVDGNGGVMILAFTEDTMTLTFVLPGDTSGQTMHVVLEDHAIISGGKPIPYELEGNVLRLVKPEGTMVMKRLTADSPVGEWTLTGLSGVDGAENTWAAMQQANAEASVIITDTYLSLVLVQDGVTDTETGSITLGDGVIRSGSKLLRYTVDGDTMTIDSDGIIMILTRRH